MTASKSPIALGPALRALRRRADLSQRQLAARSGVPASTIARIESGRAEDPKFRTVERLVTAAGEGVVIGPPAENPHDGLTDAAGRGYPPHLDVRAQTDPRPGAPPWTFMLDRRRRDRRRADLAAAERVRIVPVAAWHWIARTADEDAVVARMRACEWEAGLVLVLVEVADFWQDLGIGRRLVAVLRAEMARTGVTRARTVAVGSGAARFFELCGFERDWVRPFALTLTVAGEGRPTPR